MKVPRQVILEATDATSPGHSGATPSMKHQSPARDSSVSLSCRMWSEAGTPTPPVEAWVPRTRPGSNGLPPSPCDGQGAPLPGRCALGGFSERVGRTGARRDRVLGVLEIIRDLPRVARSRGNVRRVVLLDPLSADSERSHQWISVFARQTRPPVEDPPVANADMRAASWASRSAATCW